MINLYTAPSPNGRKVSVLLEELKVEYKCILVNLDKKEQFKKNFSKISPTNKIPVIEDCENKKIIFESGAILIYLAEKYKKYLPKNKYWEVLQWVIFQVAYVGPMLGQAHQYLYYNSGKSKFAEKNQDNIQNMFMKFQKNILLIIFILLADTQQQILQFGHGQIGMKDIKLS